MLSQDEIVYSSVLHLRGELTQQPFVSENAVLMYNGEIYTADDHNYSQNDGK